MSLKNSISFFEKYADEYDLMTNAGKREENHRQEIDHIIERFNPKAVLDAGCATGLTSSLFASRSIKTVGLDRSRSMLKMAGEKYSHLAPQLSFKYGNFEKLPQAMHGKFDLIVCLANSISGVGSLYNLYQTLKNFHHCLAPGGNLLIQMLNYFSIKDGEMLPIKATEKNGVIYQRFSERQGKRLFIYVSRADTNISPIKSELFRHEFENFDVKEMVSSLKRAGFKKIKKYGDLFFEKEFTKTARDLIISTQK